MNTTAVISDFLLNNHTQDSLNNHTQDSLNNHSQDLKSTLKFKK